MEKILALILNTILVIKGFNIKLDKIFAKLIIIIGFLLTAKGPLFAREENIQIPPLQNPFSGSYIRTNLKHNAYFRGILEKYGF